MRSNVVRSKSKIRSRGAKPPVLSEGWMKRRLGDVEMMAESRDAYDVSVSGV